jgi:WD40 repeat protein
VTDSFHINSQQQFESWKLNPFAARLFWSPTSSTVALADYEMLWEWDVESGAPPRGTVRQGAATSAWRPDGREIANANGRAELMLFETGSDALLKKFSPSRKAFDPPSSPANFIAWHPNQTKIATAHKNHAVKIWDVTNWEATQWDGHTFGVHQVAWSPDGRRLASAAGDKTVKIWDPASGDVLLTLLHDAPVIALAWAPDGQRLAALDAAGLVKIYDAASAYRLSP